VSGGRVAVFVGLGVLAFVAGAGGALGARGGLNREGLSGLPVVGALLGGGHSAAVDTSSASPEGHGEEVPGAHEEAPPHPSGEALEATFDLPRPFEAEELEALTAKLVLARKDYARRLEASAALEGALTGLSRELEQRRDELELVMRSVAEERQALDAERAALAAARVELAAGEEAALEPVARAYEEMQAPAAAERLALLETDGAAKVLALMKARKAAKVLEALPPERAAAVSSRVTALRRTSGQEAP
jgi:flagellar motility protein MotE (MotC chaperone)